MTALVLAEILDFVQYDGLEVWAAGYLNGERPGWPGLFSLIPLR